MDFEWSKRSDWVVVSEFVGTYNRCWSFDIHIFHDKDKEKASRLNIHHTVKIDVIPNTKATFSSSYVILFVSGSVFIILTSCLCSLLDLMSGSFFGLTSVLSLSPSRLIFTLVSILKLGDDISICYCSF